MGGDPAGLRRRRWFRVVAWLVIAPAAFVLIGGALLYRRYAPRWDEGWIDGERHALPPYATPAVDGTGRRLYEQAVAAMSRAEAAASSRRATTPYRGPLEDDKWMVAEYAPVYTLLHDAADQPYCSPLEPGGVSTGSFLDRGHRDRLAGAISLRLLVDRRTGRHSHSLQAAADGIALGVNTMQYAGLSDLLPGYSVVSMIAIDADLVLVAGGLPSEDYLAYADRVRELHGRAPSAEAILTFETAKCRGAMEALTQEAAASKAYNVPSSKAPPVEQRLRRQMLLWTWDRARSIEWIEDRCARLAELCRPPTAAAAVIALEQRSDRDLEARRDPVATGYYASIGGQMYIWISLQARLTAHETVARLEAYRARHGMYPESLDDLVPDFATETAVDPWSGEPLRYRTEGRAYRLYSVGQNQVDDGGLGPGYPDAKDPDEVYVSPPPGIGDQPIVVEPPTGPTGGMMGGLGAR